MPAGLDPTGMVATTVFVVPFITETVLLPPFVTYIKPLSSLKATPRGNAPTGMVATTSPCVGLVSVTLYVTGNGGFTARGVPPSEPLKVYEDPLPVVAVMVNWSAVGQATAEESKLHSTCLLTVRVLVSSVAVLVMVHARSWPAAIVPEQSPAVVVSNSISPESGLVSVIW